MSNKTISIIIPAYNECENLPLLIEKIEFVLHNKYNYEVLIIDDGSNDNTLEILRNINEKNNRIQFISLSRNFGHQNALKAGLDHSKGDCIISMDADFQHPPDLLIEMIETWEKGYDIVTTIRKEDPDLSFLKRKTSSLYYRIMGWLSEIKIPEGTADFRLIDKKVLEAIKKINEYFLFYRGLFEWLGFNKYEIYYEPGKRKYGDTKYTLLKMIKFATVGITSFSVRPLKVTTFIGMFLASASFLYGIWAVVMKIAFDQAVPGWTSVLVSVLFIGGIQLIVLGLIGEYIGKMFFEVKKRPHYLIKERSEDI